MKKPKRAIISKPFLCGANRMKFGPQWKVFKIYSGNFDSDVFEISLRS